MRRLMLLAFWSVTTITALAGEPEPVTVLEKYGPVIDRAEATDLGLFKYRPNFGALRFVRTDSGQFEARVATSLRGAMLEQTVPLDSMMFSRVGQGLLMLRDRSATNVELLLSPRYPLDASCLGPATDARARAGGVCLGLLGLGTGLVVGTALTFDEGRHELGWPEWRTKNLDVTAAITAATTLLGGFGGWYAGNRADAGRPVAPHARCAIAGYDDNGYPIYEEEVRERLAGYSTILCTGGGIAVGSIAAAIAGSIVNNRLMMMTSLNDPNGLGGGPVVVLDFSVIATVAYLGNTIGRDMDREDALAGIRHRPRPENNP
jgi:hypothetical protein